jgi:hypothetical protein
MAVDRKLAVSLMRIVGLSGLWSAFEACLTPLPFGHAHTDHLWDNLSPSRPASTMLNIDLSKYGINEKLVRPPLAPAGTKPTANDAEIRRKLDGMVKQYGTVQVGLPTSV